ncbi:MAG: hypothetical protein V1897_08510 [Pseudomonadota bacterium]
MGLVSLLQTAYEWGILTRNVYDAVKLPRAQSKEMNVRDVDEITKFLEAAQTFDAAFVTSYNEPVAEIVG